MPGQTRQRDHPVLLGQCERRHRAPRARAHGDLDTPKPAIDLLNKEVAAAVADAAVRGRFTDVGAEPITSTPEEFGRYISAEVARWKEIITRGGITLD